MRDLGNAAHLVGGEFADRQHNANPEIAVLFLPMRADMREPVESRPRRNGVRGRADELAAEPFFDRGDEFFKTPGVEYVFQARLGAIGAVAMIDKDPHHGVGHRCRLGWLDDHTSVAGKSAVAGDAAKHQPEPDARLDAVAIFYRDRLKADVIGVLQHRNDAAAVKADIEFARNAVERTLVENVKMPFAGIGPGIDQFLRIDAGGRRAGDVADIVGAGAARAQAEILDRFHHRDRVLRLDFAHLQIGARRHMGVAAGVTLGEIGEAGKLPMVENTVGDAQPAHIRFLRRRAVEQAEETPAEIVVGFRRFVFRRLFFQPLVSVERMQLALEFLRIGSLPPALIARSCARKAALSGPIGSAAGAALFGSAEATGAVPLPPAGRRVFAICSPVIRPSR